MLLESLIIPLSYWFLLYFQFQEAVGLDPQGDNQVIQLSFIEVFIHFDKGRVVYFNKQLRHIIAAKGLAQNYIGFH